MSEKPPTPVFTESPAREQAPAVREYKIREKPSLQKIAKALDAEFDQEGYKFQRGRRFLKIIGGEEQVVAIVTGSDTFVIFKDFPELFEKALTIADFVKES